MAVQKETTINPPPVEREREPTLRDVMARLDGVEKAVTVTLPKQISESQARPTRTTDAPADTRDARGVGARHHAGTAEEALALPGGCA